MLAPAKPCASGLYLTGKILGVPVNEALGQRWGSVKRRPAASMTLGHCRWSS